VEYINKPENLKPYKIAHVKYKGKGTEKNLQIPKEIA
jgi:hypothetical protein